MVVLPLVIGCQKNPELSARQHLAKAEEEVKRGKVNEAIIEYRRAIQDDPKLVVAHFELGRIYIERRDYANAAEELSETQKLEPTNLEAHVMLAEVRVRSGQFAGAKIEAEAALKQSPEEPRVLMALAQSAQGLGDSALARSSLERVLKVEPSNGRASFLLGILEWKEKKKGAAEQYLRQALENDPNWTMTVSALGIFLAEQGRLPEAEQLFQRSIANNPKRIELNYLLEALLMQQGRYPEAEEQARKIKSLGEAEAQHRGALGQYYLAVGKAALAEREYLQILEKNPEDILNKRRLAGLNIAQGKIATANRLLEEILSKEPGDPKSLLLRGQLRIQEGRFEDARTDLGQAAQTRPVQGLAHFGLGEIYLREGRLKQARQELQAASRLQPNLVAARLLLAEMDLSSGNLRGAQTALDQLLNGRPKTAVPYALRSVARALQGDVSLAEKDLVPMLHEFPQAPDRAFTYRTLAWIKFHQHRYVESRKLLEQAYDLQPTSADALYLLGLTYLVEKRTETGLAQVGSRVRAHPQWGTGYEILGKLQLLAGQRAEGEASLQKALVLDPKLYSAQFALAGAYMAEGKLDEAVDGLLKLTESQPTGATAHLLLGQLYERRQDWPRAEACYKKALELAPDSVVAKNNLAWVYVEHGDKIDFALRLAQEAKEAQPDNLAVSDTLGWIYLKKGNLANAIQLFQDNVQKQKNSPLYHYHLGLAYARSGKKDQAKNALAMALKLPGNFPEAQNARELLTSLRK